MRRGECHHRAHPARRRFRSRHRTCPDRARGADPHRGSATDGRRCAGDPSPALADQTHRGVRPYPPVLHRRPATSHDQPRPGLQFPGLHRATGLVRSPSRHRLRRRWTNHRRQRHLALRLSPSRTSQARLELHHDRRYAALDRPQLARPLPDPTNQHRAPHRSRRRPRRGQRQRQCHRQCHRQATATGTGNATETQSLSW